jgi:hypothetical protein
LKKRPKKQPPLFRSTLSPFEEAMQELKKLVPKTAAGAGETKEFHTAVADIFKRYYSRKQQQNLLNKTTGEILVLMKQADADATTLSDTAEALRRGDAVKFAKYVPPEEENKQSLSQIGNAIEQIEKSSVKINS